MPFPIERLIEGRGKPLTITSDKPVEEALGLMVQYDYSQLPVVDSHGCVRAAVTEESVLRAVRRLKLPPQKLSVTDAQASVPKVFPDEDLFEVGRFLSSEYAVIVVDRADLPLGIVTDFDMAAFFKSQAEELMLVEDIEKTLKEYILLAFPNAANDPADPALLAAVNSALGPDSDNARFKSALVEYLRLAGIPNSRPDARLVKQAFSVMLGGTPRTRGFEDLNFSQYMTMLLCDARWPQYEAVFGLDRKAVRELLDGVREIRSKVAHFSGDVTADERATLRFCRDWLQNYQQQLLTAFAPPARTGDLSSDDAEPMIAKFLQSTCPTTGASKYSRPAAFLASLNPRVNTVMLTFDQFERLIGGDLPTFAREHSSWWANDSTSRTQSKQWLGSGWRVVRAEMQAARVLFGRVPK